MCPSPPSSPDMGCMPLRSLACSGGVQPVLHFFRTNSHASVNCRVELSCEQQVKPKQLMCFLGLCGLSACANPVGIAGDEANPKGLWQTLPLFSLCCSLRLRTVVQGALDHGSAFALSCWARICPSE